MNDQTKHIFFTRKSFERFRAEYQLARDAQQDSFMFEGHEVLVAYAKYMIEYLEAKFNSRNPDRQE